MSIWALYELSEVKRYGRIYEGVIVLQGGVSLPNLKKKGGGADEYIRGLNIVDSFRNVSYRAACLYR